MDIINYLKEYGVKPIIIDPLVDAAEAKHEYGIDLTDLGSVKDADCLVFSVAHDIFKNMGINKIFSLFRDYESKSKIIIDVKSILQ